jgi:hypothetical protein
MPLRSSPENRPMEETPSERPAPASSPLRLLVILLAVYAFAGLALVGSVAYLFGRDRVSPVFRAVIGMGLTLNVVWTLTGGLLMLAFRDRARAAFQKIPLPWQVKFVLFATLLILLEEAVTVSLTNLAPLYGVKVGQAYITASTNYLDVVAFHSVVAIAPMFIGWAWLLTRYDFHPTVVFLLFGITGNLSEVQFGGPSNLTAGFWIFLYGLMIYLPAYCIPVKRGAKPPRWYHGLAAIFLPVLFSVPFLAIVRLTHHPQPTHFPPIRM